MDSLDVAGICHRLNIKLIKPDPKVKYQRRMPVPPPQVMAVANAVEGMIRKQIASDVPFRLDKLRQEGILSDAAFNAVILEVFDCINNVQSKNS